MIAMYVLCVYLMLVVKQILEPQNRIFTIGFKVLNPGAHNDRQEFYDCPLIFQNLMCSFRQTAMLMTFTGHILACGVDVGLLMHKGSLNKVIFRVDYALLFQT